MVRGVHYLAVHLDTLAVFFSDCIAVLIRPFSEPGISAQPWIVFGIDDGKETAGQRNSPRRSAIFVSDSRRTEVGTSATKWTDIPPAFGAFFLPTYQSRPAGAGCIGRKAAVVASGLGLCALFWVSHNIPP